MLGFSDVTRDPADITVVPLDWSDRLPAGRAIASVVWSANGDVVVTDKSAGLPGTAVAVQLSGGSDPGWTGDPQTGQLTVVTCTVTLDNGEVRARSFNCLTRKR